MGLEMTGMYEKYGVKYSEDQVKDLKEKKKIYRNEKMRYRLTQEDYIGILMDRLTSEEYVRIYLDLDWWYKERYYSMFITSEYVDYYKANCSRLSQDEDSIYEPLAVAVSNFFNVHYNRISEIMGFVVEDMYEYLPCEILDFISRMKGLLINSGKKKPYASDADINNFAKQLGETARNTFMKTYGIAPILIEKNEYKFSRGGEELYVFMTAKLKERGYLTEEKIQNLTDNWRKASTHGDFLKDSCTFEEMIYGRKRD